MGLALAVVVVPLVVEQVLLKLKLRSCSFLVVSLVHKLVAFVVSPGTVAVLLPVTEA